MNLLGVVIGVITIIQAQKKPTTFDVAGFPFGGDTRI